MSEALLVTTLCAGVLGSAGQARDDAASLPRERLSCLDDAQVRAAVEELGRLGPAAADAVPDLVRLLEAESLELPCASARAIAAQGQAAAPALPGLEKLAAAGDREKRVCAAGALATLAAVLPAARPPLRKALADAEPRVRREAAVALGRIEGRVAPVVAQLSNPREDARLEAERVLVELGRLAVDPLRRALASPEAALRQGAAAALGKIGPEAAPAIPALTRMLSDAEPLTSAAAAEALGAIGLRGESVLPELIALARRLGCARLVAEAEDGAGPDLDERGVMAGLACVVVADATRALAHRQPASAASLDRFTADEDVFVATVSVRARGTSVQGFDALERALRDPRPEVRRAAVEGLASMGASAGPAVSGLLDALGREVDEDGRRDLVEALGRVGGRDAARALAALVADPRSRLRGDAIAALGAVGPAGREAIPELLGAANEGWVSAAAALRAMGSLDAVPAMIRCLRDPRERLAAVKELGASLGAASEVVPSLAEILASSVKPVPERATDEDWDRARLREAAAEALGNLGSAAVPPLARALADADRDLRELAASALRNLGAQAAPAVPELERCLLDSVTTERARRDICDTLERIGPPAVPTLVRAARTPRLAYSAEQALAKVGPAAVPGLLRELGSGLPEAKGAVVSAFAALGPSARGAFPALADALASDTESVDLRARIPGALTAIDPQAAGRSLTVALASGPPEVRLASARALTRACPITAEVVSGLAARLSDPVPAVRTEAIGSLGQMGRAARSALPAVLARLSAPVATMGTTETWRAVQVVPRIDPESGVSVLASIAGARERPGILRCAAMATLGSLGSAANEAVPILSAAATDPGDPCRSEAKEALARISARRP